MWTHWSRDQIDEYGEGVGLHICYNISVNQLQIHPFIVHLGIRFSKHFLSPYSSHTHRWSNKIERKTHFYAEKRTVTDAPKLGLFYCLRGTIRTQFRLLESPDSKRLLMCRDEESNRSGSLKTWKVLTKEYHKREVASSLERIIKKYLFMFPY